MNRENFKQTFFHQLMCFLSAFNFVVTLNFHVIRHVIMSFDKKSLIDLKLPYFSFNTILQSLQQQLLQQQQIQSERY